MRSGEFEWIDQLARRFGSGKRNDGLVGIGDDAAVIPVGGSTGEDLSGDAIVISVDAQVEGVHFRPEWIGYHDLARRLLHIGFSDIAAMGARAQYALVSVEAGSGCEQADLDAFTDGMQSGLEEVGARLIGGNVSARGGGFSAHVTAIGRQKQSYLLYRSGAHSGDGIYVTGHLGSASAAIRALSAPTIKNQTIPQSLLEAYRHPRAHLREGLALAESGWATAAIDISDGLSADLGHLCGASGIGAIIELEDLPISDALRSWRANDPQGVHDWALRGGEDYVLLFTAPADPAKEALMRRNFAEIGASFWRVGTATSETQLRSRRAGQIRPLEPRGYDHFRDSPRGTQGGTVNP